MVGAMFSASDCASVNADDHNQIDAILDRLAELSFSHPGDLARIVRTLSDLRTALRLHFVIEENLMADCGYPRLHQHRNAHAFLLGELSVLVDQVHADRASDLQSVARRLHLRLRNHRDAFDAAFTNFVEAGIPAPIPEALIAAPRTGPPC